jgi:AraC-like DNA-binding protein
MPALGIRPLGTMGPMQRFVPAPLDLQPWLEGAVAVDSPAALGGSQFPAMVGSMLVVRLEGEVLQGGTALPCAAWISASTVATVYAHRGRVRAVGLVWRPEAGPSFLAAARGLVNGVRPMADMAAPCWAAAEQAIRAAGDDAGRIDALWQFVRQELALRPQCEERRGRAKALLDHACAGTQGTAPRAGVGPRQLERRFVAEWGMTPKQFQVIARFSATLQHAMAGPAEPGAHLAAGQGYYDQSHMARDMRRLAGQPLHGLLHEAAQRSPSAHWPLQVGAEVVQAAASLRRR